MGLVVVRAAFLELQRFLGVFLSSCVSVQKTPRNLSSNSLHRDMEQVQQPTTDPPQDRTFSCATVNCAKNCRTCDQGLTFLTWTIPFLWNHLFLSPKSPLHFFPFPFCWHRSHGICLHIVVQFSRSSTLKLLQATFLSIERLREISDFQHSFQMSHRFLEKRHTMSMVNSRLTFQAVPQNDSFDFNFFK